MNSITIPSKAEVAVSIERTVGNLDRLGITHNVAPVQEIDWANYIEDAQEMLNLSGSGHRSGTIYLSDSSTLTPTLRLRARSGRSTISEALTGCMLRNTLQG